MGPQDERSDLSRCSLQPTDVPGHVALGIPFAYPPVGCPPLQALHGSGPSSTLGPGAAQGIPLPAAGPTPTVASSVAPVQGLDARGEGQIPPGQPPTAPVGGQNSYHMDPGYYYHQSVPLAYPQDPTQAVLLQQVQHLGTTTAQIIRSADSLEIAVPGPGFFSSDGRASLFYNLTFGISWLGLTTVAILALVARVPTANLIFSLIVLTPFWLFGWWIVWRSVREAYLKEQLRLEGGRFCLVKSLFSWKSFIAGDSRSISSVYLHVEYHSGNWGQFLCTTRCAFTTSAEKHVFGEHLTMLEQQKVLHELRHFLGLPVVPPVVVRPGIIQ